MASNDVLIKLVADVSGLEKELKNVQVSLQGVTKVTETTGSKMTSAFTKLGGVIAGAFALDKIKDFTLGMIEATASVNALDSMFEQTFKGDQAKALEGITSQAEAQGIQIDRLKGSWASFYGTFRGNGAKANEALALTTRYMELAGDGAAYYDLALEDVVSRLKSIVMGNFEAGDAIGININATKMDTIAKQKYNKKWQELNDTQKEFLLIDTAEEIYKNSGAMGQGAREADNWANVVANLKSVWERFLSIIGQPALVIATEHIQNLTKKVEGAIVKVADFKTKFEEVYKATGNFSEALASAFDSIGLDWIAELIRGFQGIIDKVKEVIQWFKEHELATQILIGVVGGLAFAFGVLKVALTINDALNKMNKSLGESTEKMKKLKKRVSETSKSLTIATLKTKLHTVATTIATAVTTAFSTAWTLLTSPITLVILAIAGAIAIGYLLVKNWDAVKAFLISSWESIKAFASKTWEVIKNVVSSAWEGIKAVISTVCKVIYTVVKTYWELVKLYIKTVITVIKTIITTVWNVISTVISTVMKVIFTIISSVWDAIYVVIKPILDIIKTLIIAVWQGIQMALAIILSIILGIIKLAWEGIKIVVEVVMNIIMAIVSTVWNIISGIIEAVLGVILTIVKTIWGIIKGAITLALNAILAIVSSVWDGIKTVISIALEIILSIISVVWNTIKGVMTTVLNIIKGIVSTIWNGIKAIISGAVDGVKYAVSTGFNWVKDKAESIFNGLKKIVLGIWKAIGSGIQGIINGIIKVINKMVRAMNKISFKVPDWIPIMGGKEFGFNIPEISEVSWFATGGIIKGTNSGTIVGVGENGGDEAIVPLSNKTRMKPFAHAVADFMPDIDEPNPRKPADAVNINVEKLVVREEADIKKVAEELFKLQERNRRARGKN